jgi:DNA repair protein RadC
MCQDVIERVLRVLNVMIASGIILTVPNRDTLSACADTKAQVIQRRTSTSGFLNNHPSGDPKPSHADVTITREIAAALKPLAITVHNHLVVGAQGVASFKSLGLL